jgi:hypothetical protein
MLVEEPVHLLSAQLLLPRVLPELGSVGIHEIHHLAMNILVSVVMVVYDVGRRRRVVDVLLDVSSLGRELSNHIAVLQSHVSKPQQRLLCHGSSVRSQVLCSGQALEFCPLLGPEPFHLLSTQVR